MARVVVYTQVMCGYCAAARALLEKKGVVFEEIDVTMSPQRRREMMDRSGRRTVPQIFIGETHVGGFDDMAALEAQGELDALLARD